MEVSNESCSRAADREVSFDEFYGDEIHNNTHLKIAIDSFEKAGKAFEVDKLDEAIKLYKESIKHFPTSDAHTYLGWMYSMKGNFKKALEQCYKAIAIDETFGNPFNDIGSYLCSLGRPDEAVAWFEKAKKAPRSTNRPAPYINLAHYYLRNGQPERALNEFLEALRRDSYNPYLREKCRLLEEELGEQVSTRVKRYGVTEFISR